MKKYKPGEKVYIIFDGKPTISTVNKTIFGNVNENCYSVTLEEEGEGRLVGFFKANEMFYSEKSAWVFAKKNKEKTIAFYKKKVSEASDNLEYLKKIVEKEEKKLQKIKETILNHEKQE